MHLSLDQDLELLRNTLQEFAQDRLRAGSRSWDEAAEIPVSALAEGWGLSLLAAGLPGTFGGAGADDAVPSALTGVVALEPLAFGDLAYAQALFAPNHLAVPVALFGTAAEKAEHLPALCGGPSLPAATAAWIEPSRSFDLASIRTTARPSPAGGLVLRGTKAFVAGGATAETLVVYARPAESTGFDGVEAFLIAGKGAHGVTRGGREETIAPRGLPQHRLVFEDAPAVRLGGARGVAYRTLATRALTASAAAATGVARAACEYASAYAKERIAFGRPIAQYQSIAFMIADAAMDVEAARWMTWKAAWKIDRGEEALREATLAFRFATDAAWRIADRGVQILGGHGVIRDHLAELFFRNARTLASTPGTLIV